MLLLLGPKRKPSRHLHLLIWLPFGRPTNERLFFRRKQVRQRYTLLSAPPQATTVCTEIQYSPFFIPAAAVRSRAVYDGSRDEESGPSGQPRWNIGLCSARAGVDWGWRGRIRGGLAGN